MRHQGRISEWRDERGFGFVTPNGGGAQVFLHVKAFAPGQRRPVGNELVTYELASDERGRPRAANVMYVGTRAAPVRTSARRPTAGMPGPGAWSLGAGACYLLAVAGAVAAGRLPVWVAFGVVLASIATWYAYAFDKRAALLGHWRTSETMLHLLSLAGGWPGALLAQRTVRHKTTKASFRVGFWFTVFANCAVLAVAARPQILETALQRLLLAFR